MKQSDRENIFQLLRRADLLEIRRRNKRARQHPLLQYYPLYFQIIPFILAFILGFLRGFFHVSVIVWGIALTFLLIAYFSTFIYPFVIVWVYRVSLRDALKHPLNILLKNANFATAIDAALLVRLMQKPLENLELLLLELEAEKEFFERRISLVVGPIEKIGLAPGLLAVIITISNLKNQSEWVVSLGYIIPLFYCMGF